MNNARFIKIMKFDSKDFFDCQNIETIVNQTIETIRDCGAKIVSIQIFGDVPILMYHIIYEFHTPLTAENIPSFLHQPSSQNDENESGDSNETENSTGTQSGNE